jgi:plasmid stabilization system protein ParE
MAGDIIISDHAANRWIYKVDNGCSHKKAKERLSRMLSMATMSSRTEGETVYRYPAKVNGKIIYFHVKDDRMLTTVVATPHARTNRKRIPR